MNRVLTTTGLDSETCAGLLGVNPQIFREWMNGSRRIPSSVLRHLSEILGIPEAALLSEPRKGSSEADVTPAIWYKLRGEELAAADREWVLLVRRLGTFIHELEEVTKKRSTEWQVLFETIRRQTDLQAPPRVQGREAARIFRESRGLNAQRTGVGEVFRGNLRAAGILVVESPLADSRIEGCSFYVGFRNAQRPCVFANTHGTTWFRRNEVLLHEVAHAIFDAPSAGASLDFSSPVTSEHGSQMDVSEERARAFAQEAIAPAEVLTAVSASLGTDWGRIDGDDIAKLVAAIHVEKNTLASAALEAGLLANDKAAEFVQTDIADRLRRESDHALPLWDYLAKVGREKAEELIDHRLTTIPRRRLRLPAHYVQTVFQAETEGLITVGRAAELLMIEPQEYRSRFHADGDNRESC